MMVENEFRKVRRRELIERLIEQNMRAQELERKLRAAEEEIQEKDKALADKTIRLEKCGSIADAAVTLNSLYAKAQASADQYLENVKIMQERSEAKIAANEANSIKKIMDQERESAEKIAYNEAASARKITEQENDSAQKCNIMLTEASNKSDHMIAEATARSKEMIADAEKKAAAYWADVQAKLSAFYEQHMGLKEMLDIPTQSMKGVDLDEKENITNFMDAQERKAQ